MQQEITMISLVVRDYDEAIHYYTHKLKFVLVEDTPQSETKRWVRVRPPGQSSFCLLLAKAGTEQQASRIGNQTGGRVFLFLNTDNFQRDYQNLLNNNIRIVRPPSTEAYGTVAVFEDLYGNLWDLIEPIRNSIQQ
jgi:catechol 2,3-dioxygenase-like lactoylglutathione lyase family enzyme